MKVIRINIRGVFGESIVSAAVGNGNKLQLHVFDFDDTIVNTGDSSLRVKVIHTPDDGVEPTVTYLSSREYASKKLPTSGKVELDFSDFDTVPSDIELKPHFEKMKQAMKNSNSYVMILTARSDAQPVVEFLKNLPNEIFPDELGVPDVVGVGNSDPSFKSSYIKNLILDKGFGEVYFYDDAIKNVEAVASLSNDLDDVKIDVEQVEESYEYLVNQYDSRSISRNFFKKYN